MSFQVAHRRYRFALSDWLDEHQTKEGKHGELCDHEMQKINRNGKPFSGTVAIASQSEHNAKRVSELQNVMVEQQKLLERFVEPFRGLTNEQAQEVLGLAKQLQEQNRKREIEKRMKREMQVKQRMHNRGGFER